MLVWIAHKNLFHPKGKCKVLLAMQAQLEWLIQRFPTRVCRKCKCNKITNQMFPFFGPQEISKIALIFKTHQMFFSIWDYPQSQHLCAESITLGLYLMQSLYCSLLIYLTHFIIFGSLWGQSPLVFLFSWECFTFSCFFICQVILLGHILDIVNVILWWLWIML